VKNLKLVTKTFTIFGLDSFQLINTTHRLPLITQTTHYSKFCNQVVEGVTLLGPVTTKIPLAHWLWAISPSLIYFWSHEYESINGIHETLVRFPSIQTTIVIGEGKTLGYMG
jgi:hypothetical protein